MLSTSGNSITSKLRQEDASGSFRCVLFIVWFVVTIVEPRDFVDGEIHSILLWIRKYGIRKYLVEGMFVLRLRWVFVFLTFNVLAMLENSYKSDVIERKTVIVMIGLPVFDVDVCKAQATGKSYISKMLHRYLNWRGYRTKVFNAGDFRRFVFNRVAILYRAVILESLPPSLIQQIRALWSCERSLPCLRWTVFFIDFSNLALITFLLKGGDVGLFDATNSNIERRNYIACRCAHAGFNVLFLESICDDPVLIEKNCEMKLNSPGMFDPPS